MRKYNWKKIVTSALWVIAGIGAIVLLGAAVQSKNHKVCKDIKVEITGAERHMFIDEKDVLELLRSTGEVKGYSIAALNLRQMEQLVEKNAWVKNAEMFVDNNQVLQVRIEERQPVARVFALDGSSFYLDSGAMRLPLSDKLSARVPVFTSFPSTRKNLAKPDSLLLGHIVELGQYIMADSFWMAQVAQIDITPQSGFEMVPVVGDHVVILGDAEDLDKKFRRLYTFYKQVWLQNGINRYETLDVQYDKQVVAIKKGTGKARVDSARAHELMQALLSAPVPTGDSSTTEVKPVVVKKDSTPVVKPAPVAKAAAKGLPKKNSVSAANNKAGKKALTNEKKSGAKKTTLKTTQKKGTTTTKQPKAILQKPKAN